MTSAARTNDFRRGFSLLEIVIVLAIAAVITGGALAFMAYSDDERTLGRASGEVEVMAKRARSISILQQTPYALEFREGEVRLMPFAEAGRDDRQILEDVGVTTNDDIRVETKYVPVYERFAIPDGMAVSVRRWNTLDWIPIAKKELQIWRFDPDGLCEPVSVRYGLERGWVIDTFHPLTAAIRDKESEMQ